MGERVLVVRYGEASRAEPVIETIEAVATRVEAAGPGICLVSTRGPSRYFGGDRALATHISLLVDEALRASGSDSQAKVGIADGVFAAKLAALHEVIVDPGDSPNFLAPFPITVLERPQLVDLLCRLGLRTLGDFAALPVADVFGRFGVDGAIAHRWAAGLDETSLQVRVAPVDWSVSMELDPPLLQMHTAAFVVKTLAERLTERLQAEGMSCLRLRIEASTVSGETLTRTWRHDSALSAFATAERLRWQLESWLTRNAERSESEDGILHLGLVPEDVIPHDGHRVSFWNADRVSDDRIERALARVQGLLGEGGVVTAVAGGGRSYAEQIRLVSWGEAREPRLSLDMPWPGRLPGAAPASVYERPLRAEVFGEDGRLVSVDARGTPSAPPSKIAFGGGGLERIIGWSGPWILDERWWDAEQARRCARFQLSTSEGSAVLAVLQGGRWWVEARYD